MNILAIDTSADETSAAVVSERRVLSHVEYSQVLTHKEWGGIVPSIAKRAHEERIDWVVEETLRKYSPTPIAVSMEKIDAIAVTYGPGLAIALEVGIKKAKELSALYKKKLIAVNHMEGHIYSVFAQNSKGRPEKKIVFPFLALLISGGHTEIVLVKDHITYQVLGATRDDAAGEALDKAARLMGLGYPGGPSIERLAHEVGNVDRYMFPRPMIKSKELDFSFSGLKTAFFYHLRTMTDDEKVANIHYLVSSLQEAVIDILIVKMRLAVEKTKVTQIVVGGGVSANARIRLKMRRLVKEINGSVLFSPYSYLTGDNAAMIGIAAFYKAEKGIYVSRPEEIDRVPRLSLPV